MLTKFISPICEIAHGGMGSVVLAVLKEGTFRRLYAIKRLHPHLRKESGVRSMFLDEARVAGLIRHPNVVSVLDVGEDEEGSFLLMDFVDGVSVANILEETAARGELLPLQLCLSICLDTARGLHAAHELLGTDGKPLELVHRDVSPQNILVGFDGMVRVTDFGIAKAFGNATKTSLGVLKGNGGYMSPEQLRFEEPDRRSDLFSLGVVLYELVAGQPLYAATPGTVAARRILTEQVPDIGDVRDDVPGEVAELLFRLVAKDKTIRPASAAEVAATLEGILISLLRDEARLDAAAYLGRHFGHLRISHRPEVKKALEEPETPPAATAGPRRWARPGVAILAAVSVAVAVVGVLVGGRPGVEPNPPPGLKLPSVMPPAASSNYSSAVWAGSWHTCANRGAVVFCWGKNNEGQLGTGTTWDWPLPLKVVPEIRNVIDADGGDFHTCVLTREHRISCFGRNREGQLGTGSTTDSVSPAPLAGAIRFIDIDAGGSHSCGVSEDGQVFCWGKNNRGQLGLGSMDTRLEPTPVPGVNGARQVSASLDRTCLIAQGGVVCWGQASLGQESVDAARTGPLTVAGLDDAAEVRTGSAFACARRRNGHVACWGQNDYGQLGDGSTVSRATPRDIPDHDNFVAIAVGHFHACGLQSTGGILCWGRNLWGNVGSGVREDVHAPTPVAGVTDAISVAAGAVHSCARLKGGIVACWGHNDTGQIGDGTRGTNRRSPVAVAGID